MCCVVLKYSLVVSDSYNGEVQVLPNKRESFLPKGVSEDEIA
jgi:hypothetical protein